MKSVFKSILVALALAISSPFAAQAAERVVVDFGNVAFGYQDGYWDRGHHWHHWRHHRDWERYREEQREHAYEWRHDRDHDHGWHDPYWH